MSRRTPDEQGSIAAMTAVMAVALLAMVGLVVDGGRAVVARRVAMDDAAEAARSGVDALSISALRSGSVQIDPSVAIESAHQFLAAAGVQGSVDVTGQTVTVQVVTHEPTAVLSVIGIRSMTVTATASATDVHGVTEGD
jgi:Flp pilus assembly protein TadG